MPTNLLDDPQHWRDRAEEMRVVAEQIDDFECRSMLLKIVGDYEALARRAEERASLQTKPAVSDTAWVVL